VLTVGRGQLSALLDASLPGLAAGTADYLRALHGEAVSGLDEALLLRRTLAGLRRARGWGFETRFGLNLFVALMF
jgi:hypothetical protein